MLTHDRAPAALTPPAIRPGRGGARARFGSLALALALAALGQPTGPPTMVAPRAAPLTRLSDRVIRFKHWEDGIFV